MLLRNLIEKMNKNTMMLIPLFATPTAVNFKANQDFELSIVSIIQSKKIEERTNKKVVSKKINH